MSHAAEIGMGYLHERLQKKLQDKIGPSPDESRALDYTGDSRNGHVFQDDDTIVENS